MEIKAAYPALAVVGPGRRARAQRPLPRHRSRARRAELRTARGRDPELRDRPVRRRPGLQRLLRAARQGPRSGPHEMVRGRQRGRTGDPRRRRNRPPDLRPTTRATGSRPPASPPRCCSRAAGRTTCSRSQQSLRAYNQVRHAGGYAALMVGDLGHAPASNKQNSDRAFNEEAAAFFAAKLQHHGSRPRTGASPPTPRPAPRAPPARRPLHGQELEQLAPHAVTFGGAAAQSFTSAGASPTIAAEFDPIAEGEAEGGGNVCKETTAAMEPDTATYTTTSPGFTLLGLPTVTATVSATGPLRADRRAAVGRPAQRPGAPDQPRGLPPGRKPERPDHLPAARQRLRVRGRRHRQARTARPRRALLPRQQPAVHGPAQRPVGLAADHLSAARKAAGPAS